MPSEQGVRAGRAFVEMSLKDEAFQKGLAGITRRLGAMGKVLKTVGAGLLGGGLAAGGGLLASAKVFASMGSKLTDMADATGISAQGLSELKYVAEQSGASLEDVNTGVAQMNRNVNNLRRGIPQAERAFSELGLSAQDLADLSPDQQFTLIADRLSKVDDAGQRAALAMEIFGRGGKKLMPLLAQGAEGMNAMRKQARDLGVTMSNEDAQAADKLDDALAGLWSQMKGLVMTIGAAVAGPLTDAIRVFQAVLAATIHWISQTKKLGSVFGETFKTISDAVGSGNIQEGIDVLFAGINLVFAEGTATATKIWEEFWAGMRGMVDEWYDWLTINVKKGLNYMAAAGISMSGEDIDPNAFLEESKADLDREAADRKRAREDRAEARGSAAASRIEAAQQAAEEARKAFEFAKDVAKEATQRSADASPVIPATTMNAIRTAAATASSIVAGASASSLFDARFASRVFGGGPADVQQKQLEVLREIRDNTEDLAEAGGIAVL